MNHRPIRVGREPPGRRFGVEPICRVLSQHGVPIASSGYYAARTRPPSARAVRDERVLAQIRRVFHDRNLGRGLYGVRKVFHPHAGLCDDSVARFVYSSSAHYLAAFPALVRAFTKAAGEESEAPA